MRRIAIAALFPLLAAMAQSKGQTPAGIFTEAQAGRGAELYAARCASCHRPDLSGDAHSPALAGIGFAFVWGGRPLAELYGMIARDMPPEQPGGLLPANYADILAFILRANGYPAGAAELPGDEEALAGITIPGFN